MDIDSKLRPLYLLQILKERTDEDNYLTTTQLCDILKAITAWKLTVLRLKVMLRFFSGLDLVLTSDGRLRINIDLLIVNLKLWS